MTIRVYIALNKMVFLFGILLSFFASSLNAQVQDSTEKRFLYFINSNPFNAEVYYRDSLLGLTPARFSSMEKLSGNILIKKKGYKEETFDLKDYDFEKGKEFILKSLFVFNDKVVLKDKGTSFVKKRSLTGILASGLVALATGTIAYNTKEKANNYYNQYLNNRSQDNLDKSNKFDLYSGISLALMQVSIAGLIYFLLF
jgi:hypothetical protein